MYTEKIRRRRRYNNIFTLFFFYFSYFFLFLSLLSLFAYRPENNAQAQQWPPPPRFLLMVGGGAYISVPVVTQAGALCRRDDRRRRYCTFSNSSYVCVRVQLCSIIIIPSSAHACVIYAFIVASSYNIIILLARSCEHLRRAANRLPATTRHDRPFCFSSPAPPLSCGRRCAPPGCKGKRL